MNAQNTNANNNENIHLLHSPYQGYHSIPTYHWLSHSTPQRQYSPLPQTYRPHHLPVAPSDIIYVDTTHDSIERKKKFALVAIWTAAVLAAVALVFGLATLLMLREMRQDRDLENRHVHIQQIPQPKQLKDALKHANIIHVNGGVSTFLNNDVVMWSFRETLYTNRQTNQIQLLPNSALIAQVNSEGEIKSCKFLVDSDGNPTPLLMPISANKKVAAQIAGPGIMISKSKAFVFWDYQTIQDENHVPILNYTDNSKIRSNLPSFGKSEVVLNNSVILSEESDPSFSHKILTLFHISNKVKHPEDSLAPYAVLDPNQQYVYLYFRRKVDEKVDIVLARVTIDEIGKANPKYLFYTGKSEEFSSEVSIEHSPAIFSEWSSDSSMSIAWNNYLNRYCIIVTSADGQITLRTSEQPFGKWSPGVLIVSRSSKELKDSRIHSASFHQEMWKEDGRVMTLSYSVQDNNVSHPLLFQKQTPQLVTITIRKEYKSSAVLA